MMRARLARSLFAMTVMLVVIAAEEAAPKNLRGAVPADSVRNETQQAMNASFIPANINGSNLEEVSVASSFACTNAAGSYIERGTNSQLTVTQSGCSASFNLRGIWHSAIVTGEGLQVSGWSFGTKLTNGDVSFADGGLWSLVCIDVRGSYIERGTNSWIIVTQAGCTATFRLRGIWHSAVVSLEGLQVSGWEFGTKLTNGDVSFADGGLWSLSRG